MTGRIRPLRTIDENSLEDNKLAGKAKAGERTAVLTPNFPLTKITSGDILCIPWGIRPNTWTPPMAPQNTGPAIILNTPSGLKLLIWNGSGFTSDTLNLTNTALGWCLSGEVDFCFQTDNFICEPFPAGYSFYRVSGPYAEFEILRIDTELDHLGAITFYTLYLDSNNIQDLILQE